MTKKITIAIALTLILATAVPAYRHYEATFSGTFKRNAVAMLSCGMNQADRKWYEQQARTTAKTDRDREWLVKLDHYQAQIAASEKAMGDDEKMYAAAKQEVQAQTGETRLDYLHRMLEMLKHEQAEQQRHWKIIGDAEDRGFEIRDDMAKDLGISNAPCDQPKAAHKPAPETSAAPTPARAAAEPAKLVKKVVAVIPVAAHVAALSYPECAQRDHTVGSDECNARLKPDAPLLPACTYLAIAGGGTQPEAYRLCAVKVPSHVNDHAGMNYQDGKWVPAPKAN